MAKSITNKLLIAILKGLLAAAESSPIVKGVTTSIAELAAMSGDLSPDDEKTLKAATPKEINDLLSSVRPDQLSEAFVQIDLATKHSAFSAAGIIRVEKQLAEQFAALQKGQNEFLPKLIEAMREVVASELNKKPSPKLNIPTAPLRDGASPANLLNARYKAIDFSRDIREELWSNVEQWCKAPEPVSVRLFVGPGGSGKTRLFIELAGDRREAGWNAGFWPDGATTEGMQALVESDRPTLVVIDYAETRPELRDLLKCVAGTPRTVPLRVVLVAREVADWWQSLRQGDDGVDALLAHHAPTELKPVPLDGPLRQRFFEKARARYAELRNKPEPTEPVDLSDDHFGRPLYLQMAALAVVDGLDPAADTLLKGIVGHEQRLWGRRFKAEHPKDHFANTDFEETAARTVAALTLRGGVKTFEDARHLNEKAGGPSVKGFTRFLNSLYPGPSPDETKKARYLTGLEPDLLGEQLVIQVLENDHTPADYLLDIFSDNDLPAIAQAFTILGRVSLRHDRAIDWMARLLDTDVSGRAPLAFLAAMTLGRTSAYGRLGRLLAERLEGIGTEAAAAFIDKHAPDQSVSLRELSCWATQRLLDALPAGAADEKTMNKRARLLNNLGGRLSELGRREEALKATAEAVAIFYRLTEAQPDTFSPHLATALCSLGAKLRDLGHREQAMEATREAVEILRKLAKARPDESRHGLAAALNSLGVMLSDLGRRESALEASREATGHYRELAEAAPATFLPGLAMSLNNQAQMLNSLEQHEKALEALRESVEILRKQAAARPDAFLPNLATGLNNLGILLSKLGRREEALKATVEAVEIRRKLAEARPDAFLPDLAMSLNNLGSDLSALGRREEALKVSRESVEHYVRLTTLVPARFLHELKIAVRGLARDMKSLEQDPHNDPLVVEAVKLIERLEADNEPPPDAPSRGL